MAHPLPYSGNAVALEASAGMALACAYSSSDEYEAEIIAVRRRAGAYGSPRRYRRYGVAALAAFAAAGVAAYLIS
jgi:hypothetical protein